MNLYDTHTMKRGAILVDVCGYTGEEDFYAMHKIIDEVIKPEDSGFSVDSMCIGGYFNKMVFLSVPAVKALMTA